MNRLKISALLTAVISLLMIQVVLAQSNELTLRLSRDWGYGGGNGDIQGTFSMKTNSLTNLTRVEFYIDETKIGEDTESPYALQFVTDSYPLGVHALYAIGYLTDGSQVRTQSVRANFVSASQSTKAAMGIIIPMLVIVFGALILAAVIPLVTGRKTRSLVPGSPRQYPLGGGICPKCRRPFAFHIYGLNLMMNKFDRCPYCGRWSSVKSLAISHLREAEQAELAGVPTAAPEVSDEEKLKKELEDSKYQGM
jgi:hypothetical protein